MSDMKLVKVDNWGIYFLQRLKHFFNRTDYCDLILQFQDNAQLKVHRLVLSACTEYFELLERTCEMYEDCLVMPDDLQADVVVPIVNFMYTGQLEFKMNLVERLYQTSQIMNMPVLTKLLEAHRNQPVLSYSNAKRSYNNSKSKQVNIPITPATTATNKRPFSKAFESVPTPNKKSASTVVIQSKPETVKKVSTPYRTVSPVTVSQGSTSTLIARKAKLSEPRPTRYEIPEELDAVNIFDESFTNISYTSQPLMVHPESTKNYSAKKPSTGIFSEPSSSKKFSGTRTLEFVECKKMANENIFEDEMPEAPVETQALTPANMKTESNVSNHLFDQILDHEEGPKVTIETKDNKQGSNIDHAKIISEVLKKYPHLVNSNKNIKLKILNAPSAPSTTKSKKQMISAKVTPEEINEIKTETPDYTYETDVWNSKEAAKIIALGADNVKGPWICLICGTPGRALHFTSYYKFRRHLVEIHNEKPISNMCEYCGLKSFKRNYLLHHMLTKHNVEPPPQYKFPKCNQCSYIALTEAFLVKHKLSHADSRNFRCNVCAASYNSSNQLLGHIQSTGHKYSADRKTNLQCIYCLKVFLRESNLYAHLKTNHKFVAKTDGIIDDSDEEKQIIVRKPEQTKIPVVKYEPPNFESEYDDGETQYQIRADGNIQLVSRKAATSVTPTKQKILNSGFGSNPSQKPKAATKPPIIHREFPEELHNTHNQDEIVMIDNNEYIMRDNQLILKSKLTANDEFIMPEMLQDSDQMVASTSMDFPGIHDSINEESVIDERKVLKKSETINQPIQFVVSNAEEYKALMNSNHSIIFEDGDTNKTLTVLSTANNPSLNATAIDLDNTQSNDMMIIQDNYQLNVSQALPVDNSNIVVVYSHPVDDQNKQFQIIASQDIGAQFVQSSAVLTQNYGAITTSTPVMSAHVIEAQAPHTWQESVQQNVQEKIVNLPEQSALTDNLQELSEMTIINQTDIARDNDTSFDEVTLTSEEQPQETVIHVSEIEQGITSVSGEEANGEEPPDSPQVVEEEVQNISAVPMHIDVQNASVTEEIMTEKPVEIVNQGEMNTDTRLDINPEDAITESTDVEEGPDEIEQSEVINERGESQEITEDDPINIKEPENPHEISGAQDVLLDNNEVTLTPITREQIGTLTSEWSEDEYETEAPETEIIEHSASNQIADEQQTVGEDTTPTDVEESIENIQQEMEKQMVDTNDPEIVTEKGVNSVQDNNITISQEKQNESEPALQENQVETETEIEEESEESQLDPEEPQEPGSTVVPQEKISSLLNDWEDNDSQEGNSSTIDNVIDSAPKENDQKESTNGQTDQVIENTEIKKDDKIKSLVSDWDEEEEEKTE